ncbi:hypothetical protein [Pseudonocardia sp. ICBG601]|uniref:hypothetical protein n=1 Tax=Pseudonocardia sp. ICBG601 TaxID=2846759 RepID=UPI001CF61BCA|nr:hypothetical protein [Pseudonocardia sp. ICBG601]
MPSQTIDIARAHPTADLDRLEWAPVESRPFSDDLLRLAVRQGAPTPTGIVVAMKEVANLGRAAEIRESHSKTQQALTELRRTATMQALREMFPGQEEADSAEAERIRESSERAAQEAEDDLARDLAVPARTDLVDHWRRLGGRYPD